mgnify:CR=1 FL=1
MKAIYDVIVAQAFGDAFAMPSEQMTREQIKRCFGSITSLRDGHPENIVTGDLKRAEVTDDTILSLLLAKQMIDHKGRLDAAIYIQYIEEWMRSHPTRENIIGPSTKKAVSNFLNGMELEDLGLMGETNGAAMRILPIGIVYDFRKKNFLEMVYEASRSTHNTTIAVSCAAAVATCISYGVRGGRDIHEMIEEAKNNAKASRVYGRDLGYAKFEERLDILFELLECRDSLEEKLRLIHEGFGTSYQSIDSVTAALAIVKLTDADVSEAVEIAANLGGDTDTIASMAAGICASLRGIESIDPKDISAIEQANEIDFSYYERELSVYVE